MSGPIITIRRLQLVVPLELYADPSVAEYRARTFAHLHGVATPRTVSVTPADGAHVIVIEELGDAAVAASAKRAKR